MAEVIEKAASGNGSVPEGAAPFLRELQRLVELDPKDARTLQKIGELYQKKNDNGNAASYFLQVAECYSAEGFFLKAVAVYKQVLKLDASLIDVNFKLAELYQQLGLMSDAMQQYQIVAELMADINPPPGTRRSTVALASSDFPQIIWLHTLLGFLLDPEAGANRNYVGWKVIGRDPAHSFSPPFGFYDKDYPGWQPNTPETDKQ